MLTSTSTALRGAGLARNLWAALVTGAAASSASASGLKGDALDNVANFMSWFVICIVPIAALVLFWMVHVMPEKIAHKRHHPQTKAIQVLCLLSLVFGGLLWPLAWLWAYTKPTSYRLAYGTDKHEDYHRALGERARRGELPAHEVAHLRDELDSIAARGALSPELQGLRADIAGMAPVDRAAKAAAPPEPLPPVQPGPAAAAAVGGAA